MKFRVLIILFALVALSGCWILNSKSVSSIIRETQLFRDAEQIYKKKYGSYATVEELIDKKLLEKRFADLEEHGYRFNLAVGKDQYILSVIPEVEENKANSDDDNELSLYVDESGVVRASIKRNTPANSESSPISPK